MSRAKATMQKKEARRCQRRGWKWFQRHPRSHLDLEGLKVKVNEEINDRQQQE